MTGQRPAIGGTTGARADNCPQPLRKRSSAKRGAIRTALAIAFLAPAAATAWAGPYAPAAGVAGSDAIGAEDPRFTGWATSYSSFSLGKQAMFDSLSPLASYGQPANALGKSDVVKNGVSDPEHGVVSLGDGGSITLHFAQPIRNGPGPDFAVFENSFSNTFLELAFVEVSSDGSTFFRFPAVSLTPTAGLSDDLPSLRAISHS